LLPLYTHVSRLFWTGQPLAYPTVEKTGAAAAAGGTAEESVLRYAVRMMLPAQGLLTLGLVGDTYVTMRLIFESHALAMVVA
jgi:hypothetical protein